MRGIELCCFPHQYYDCHSLLACWESRRVRGPPTALLQERLVRLKQVEAEGLFKAKAPGPAELTLERLKYMTVVVSGQRLAGWLGCCLLVRLVCKVVRC